MPKRSEPPSEMARQGPGLRGPRLISAGCLNAISVKRRARAPDCLTSLLVLGDCLWPPCEYHWWHSGRCIHQAETGTSLLRHRPAAPLQACHPCAARVWTLLTNEALKGKLTMGRPLAKFQAGTRPPAEIFVHSRRAGWPQRIWPHILTPIVPGVTRRRGPY